MPEKVINTGTRMVRVVLPACTCRRDPHTKNCAYEIAWDAAYDQICVDEIQHVKDLRSEDADA